MWWIILPLLAGFLAYVVILNAKPLRCPVCHRVNVFRRVRTGETREQSDDEGAVQQFAAEITCRVCMRNYWIVWHDFSGYRASVSADADDDF